MDENVKEVRIEKTESMSAKEAFLARLRETDLTEAKEVFSDRPRETKGFLVEANGIFVNFLTPPPRIHERLQ
jgi:hypothetical protein